MSYQLNTPGTVDFLNWGAGDSDDAYESRRQSISKIATLQTPTALPDWLTTNPDSLMQELLQMYGRVPKQINAKGIGKAYDNAIGTAEGMGGQIANNAAAEAVARSGINGGQINSSMVKAQSMLPVYDTTSKLKTDKAGAMLEARKAQAGMMTSIAGQLASLRTSYLTNLGQLRNQTQQTTNSWTMGQQELAQRQQGSDRQYQLSMQQLAQRGAGGGGTPPTFSGAMTRSPNGGAAGKGVEYTPQFEQFLKELGPQGKDLINRGPEGYPAGGGINFGDSLDDYEGWQRKMGSLASGGRVAPYNNTLIDITKLNPANSFFNDPTTTFKAGKPDLAQLLAMLQTSGGGGSTSSVTSLLPDWMRAAA